MAEPVHRPLYRPRPQAVFRPQQLCPRSIQAVGAPAVQLLQLAAVCQSSATTDVHLIYRDTWSDLQLFTAVNFAFVLLCVAAKNGIVRAINNSPPVQLMHGQDLEASSGLLSDLYRIAAVILGQNFPEDPGSVGMQVFYLIVGLLGVASFALVLALIEQVVLDGFEANVRKGSAVYESNHVCVCTTHGCCVLGTRCLCRFFFHHSFPTHAACITSSRSCTICCHHQHALLCAPHTHLFSS